MKQRIKELDALRGFAAFAVVIFHYSMDKEQSGFHFNIGCMGVDLFFIVSGFVIIMTIQNSVNWKAFLVSRFSRLYPAYWTCVSITAFLVFLSTKTDLFTLGNPELTQNLFWAYGTNMTMFQYYFKAPDMDGAYWTLIIELTFYVLMLLLLAFRKIDKLEILGTAAIFLIALYSFDPLASHPVFQKLRTAIPLTGYFPLFFAGILLYKMKFEKRTALRLGIFILTFFIQCLIFHNCYRNRFYLSFAEYASTLLVIYVLFLLFLFGRLSFIVNSVTFWLGKISYSLYLLHQVIGVYFIIPFLTKVVHLNFWPAAGIATASVLLLAHLVNILVEQPAMRYIREKARPFIYKNNTKGKPPRLGFPKQMRGSGTIGV